MPWPRRLMEIHRRVPDPIDRSGPRQRRCRSRCLDPYPFILLNLLLSMLAALHRIIMMSQNRQDSRDRRRRELDFEVKPEGGSRRTAGSGKVNQGDDEDRRPGGTREAPPRVDPREPGLTHAPHVRNWSRTTRLDRRGDGPHAHSLEPVPPHPHIELMPGESERLRGFRLVEAHVLERLFDERPLHRLQIADARRHREL
jgi:hypothetical protein